MRDEHVTMNHGKFRKTWDNLRLDLTGADVSQKQSRIVVSTARLLKVIVHARRRVTENMSMEEVSDCGEKMKEEDGEVGLSDDSCRRVVNEGYECDKWKFCCLLGKVVREGWFEWLSRRYDMRRM